MAQHQGIQAVQVSVLVIEDDPETQDMLLYLLKEAGYEVHVAGSGEAGLAMLDEAIIDLVLLDLRLPGIDGFEVCRRIRADTGGNLPILMLTAGMPRGAVRGLQLGADDYLLKPFAPDELLARIASLLRRQQASLDLVNENGALRAMLELSQRELAEAQTTSTVETTLRREFLHNVTTHLQSLYTVLEAEWRRAPVGVNREVMQRTLGRVRGVGLVYQISEVLQEDPVHVEQVVHTIANALKNIYSPRKRIPLAVEGDSLMLPASQAAPLAMIVNELVTNCFKHAFPEQRFGSITVRYGSDNRHVHLHVIDDGVGMDPDAAPTGRGRTTVAELAHNLQGQATWQSSPQGTTVTVSFPYVGAAALSPLSA